MFIKANVFKKGTGTMVLATSVMRFASAQSLPFRVVETFPAYLSVVKSISLAQWLDEITISRLNQLEKEMRGQVEFAPLLLARTDKGIEQAVRQGFQTAAEYYIESGIQIWRALKHDYSKLLQLSRASCEAIEQDFFRNAKKLREDTFIKAVSGIRVWGKVSEWVIIVEEKKASKDGALPLDYLLDVVYATFFTSCLLAYIKGDVKRARKDNLKAIADAIWGGAEERFKNAIRENLPQNAGETQYWYWSPKWQEGEVEADLDKSLARTKGLDSIEDLISELR